MKKRNSSDQPKAKIVGDTITLGEYGNAPVIYVGKTAHAVGSVWRRPPEELAPIANSRGLFTVPKGTRARIVAFGYPAVDRVRCAKLKILSGRCAGDTGWIVAPRKIDPLSPSNSAAVGECLILPGKSDEPGAGYPAMVASSSDALDELMDVFLALSKEAILPLIRMRRVIASDAGLIARVIGFSRTARRKVNCAELEILEGALTATRIWCLLSEEPRSGATTEGGT